MNSQGFVSSLSISHKDGASSRRIKTTFSTQIVRFRCADFVAVVHLANIRSASLYNSLACVLCFNGLNINDSKQNSRWINSGWYNRTDNPRNDLNIWTLLTQWPG